MRLHYYRGEAEPGPWRNFGDDLNPWFWSQLLSEQFTEDPSDPEVFVGIGTILNDTVPRAQVLHIMGSGAGYGRQGARAEAHWRVHCVRGPLTARTIGVPDRLAITDPAILIPRLAIARSPCERGRVGFMPHVSMDNPRMQRVAARAGLAYISPGWDREEVLSGIDACDRIITSAMHGAIVADSLRVPWLACVTSEHIHRFKWEDWCMSMELSFTPERIPSLWNVPAQGVGGSAKALLKDALAVRVLRRLVARGRFIHSSNRVLNQRSDRLGDVIADFDASRRSVER